MNNLDFAFQVMVIGFLVVMFTLFLLFAILIIFSRIFKKTEKYPLSAEPIGDDGNINTAENVIDPRIIAAITASIYEYMHNCNNYFNPGGVNISIQHARNNNWKYLGRKRLLETSNELAEIRRKKQRENF